MSRMHAVVLATSIACILAGCSPIEEDNSLGDTSVEDADTQPGDVDTADIDSDVPTDKDAGDDASGDVTDAVDSADTRDAETSAECGPNPPMPASAFSTVYDVGPGEAYATPNEVPWESLSAGTLVRIHHRAEPYAVKWVINSEGTADQPIVVRGVPDGDALPVITGENATTRDALDFWSESRGVIKVGGSSTPSTPNGPAYIHIENLEITGAKASNSFTDDGGSTGSYDDNAAAIYIEAGSNIVVRNCDIHGNGNGLFSAWASRDILVSGNNIWGNGNEGSIFEHNSYTESQGITFQYNRYGPLCDGCPGNNLKDRSAGTVVRHNWIEGGNRQLDLVDSTHEEQLQRADYNTTMAYGNVLLETPDQGNSQVVHYGGDSGDTQNYRKGTLYFFHNTVVSTRSGNTTLMRLSTNDENAYVRNNIVHATAGGARLAIIDDTGLVDLENNWLTDGWVSSHSGTPAGSIDASSNVTGGAPGFLDLDGRDFSLAGEASASGAAGGLEDPAFAPECQYRKHAAGAVRTSAEDPGAVE
jgi:hypothetical protein